MPVVVACGQFVPRPGDIAANVAIMGEQMVAAAGAGAGILVFPELCLTGYLPPDEIAPLAVAADDPALDRLRDAARRYKIDIAFGFAEVDGDATYNSMAYMDSTGAVLATYHKTHLWDSERRWARPGSSLTAFDAGHARCGMWICYDTRFPELARVLALDGATLGLVATAWLGPGEEWELAMRARAMDNGMFVAGSALQGTYADFESHGGSVIINPHGRVLASAPPGSERVITAEYDEAVLAGFRGRVPLLAHRRLDLYGPLLQPGDW